MEAEDGIEPTIGDLQSPALPLCYSAILRAGWGSATGAGAPVKGRRRYTFHGAIWQAGARPLERAGARWRGPRADPESGPERTEASGSEPGGVPAEKRRNLSCRKPGDGHCPLTGAKSFQRIVFLALRPYKRPAPLRQGLAVYWRPVPFVEKTKPKGKSPRANHGL